MLGILQARHMNRRSGLDARDLTAPTNGQRAVCDAVQLPMHPVQQSTCIHAEWQIVFALGGIFLLPWQMCQCYNGKWTNCRDENPWDWNDEGEDETE
eukprot:scaffold327880_cov58-Tisochrysis_lutea.AAC.1